MKQAVKYLFPNGITLLHLGCGWIVLYWIGQDRIVLAAPAVFAAALLDMIDGYLARRFHAESKFGAWFDSAADWITFGLAVPLLVYAACLQQWGIAGMIWMWVYSAAVLYRLIRFTAYDHSHQQTEYRGLPCPVAGCFFAALIWVMQMPYDSSVIHFAVTGILVVALILMPALMISTVPIEKRFDKYIH